MGSKISLHRKTLEVIKTLNEEIEGEYYKISPEEYKELLSLSSYNGKSLSKIKQFRGKKIYITGKLDLSRKPVENIGNISIIDGHLDISNTNVRSIGDTEVRGYVWDHGSPRERIRLNIEINEKDESLIDERINKSRDLDNPDIDEISLRMNAVIKFIKENPKLGIELIPEEETEELSNLYSELRSLEGSEQETRIEEMQERIEEIRDGRIDVYDIVKGGSLYSLNLFKINKYEYLSFEFTTGNDEEMEDSALKNTRDLIEDTGLEGIRSGFVERYLDEESIINLARSHYEDDVRENPDVYFSPDDYSLTNEQERRVEFLENYIGELETSKSDLEDRLENIEDEIENPDELEKVKEELEEKIEKIQDTIYESQDELDSINDSREVTESMIEEKVEDLINSVKEDPKAYLDELGLDYKEYVDMESLAQGVVDADGWGIMNSYDGQYDSVSVNGEWIYVMRINE